MTAAPAKPTDAVLEAAADWRLRMDAPGWTPADEAALEAWLAADPAHADAFDRTGQVWEFFDEHAASPEMMRARRDAIDRAQRHAAGPGWLLRMPRPAKIAAGIAAAIVLGAGIYPLVDGKDVYRTGFGERRVVTLADGSKLSLDGRTKIVVRYTRAGRDLKLLSGQARFDVASDPLRPFKVAARDQTVVATGTAFNIDVSAPVVCVTLIEGHAVVLDRDAIKAKPVELGAGQQLLAPANAKPVVEVANLTEATAWQQGKIIFDDEPLTEAVERVNRYTKRHVTVSGEAARAQHVSGVFDAGDVDAFVEAVTYYLPVTAKVSGDEIVLSGTSAAG
ncbi:MAG TPA: FecR domain-containing protein [Caulobacteraceae bacterium]